MRYHPDDAPRTSGCAWPWDPLQVASWALIAFFAIVFYVFNGLFLRHPLDSALCVVYGVLATGAVVGDAVASRADAADPGIWQPLTDEEMYGTAVPDGRALCHYCRAFVDPSSKHCGRCRKCVLGFDHHCRWLNNCIGAANYRRFAAFVAITSATLLLQSGVSLYQVVDSALDPQHYRTQQQSLYRTDSLVLYRGIVGATAVLAFLAAALLLHLIGFHVMLAVRGQTTYEWILNRRRTHPEDLAATAAGELDPVARNSVRPLPDTYTRRMQSAASERTSTPKTGDDESPSSGGGCSTSSYRSGPAAGRRNSIRVMGPRTPRTADGAHQSTIASKAKDESADVPRGIPLPVVDGTPISPPPGFPAARPGGTHDPGLHPGHPRAWETSDPGRPEPAAALRPDAADRTSAHDGRQALFGSLDVPEDL
jgi:hypothetical protein